jgi:hypothetical protein
MIGFLSNKLTLRGTEVAMYDYADYNETLLGNKSIIITRDYERIKGQHDVSLDAYNKFKNRFTVEYYQSQQDIDNIVKKYGLTYLYIIKGGQNDGLITTNNSCKNLIHCVFNTQHPHGQVYSPISQEVNRICGTNYSVVPHMIRLFDTSEDLRKELNIPKDAIVFGRYGGSDAFNITFVHKCIIDILKNKNIYFLFMNTDKFYEHPNIIYLAGTSDLKMKRKMINSCNALIHARHDGETFGLTCGEFAVALKPVITYYNNRKENNHIDTLGEKAVLYTDYNSLYKIFDEFAKDKYDMTNNGFLQYTPENVMNIFKNVFLI